jgi:hypothetical protein
MAPMATMYWRASPPDAAMPARMAMKAPSQSSSRLATTRVL